MLEILTAHRQWVESQGKEGQPGHLAHCDLNHLNLADVNLQSANLQGANLQGVNFQGAYLAQTVLRDADLREADLTGARGGLLEDLAGTDLSRARLPKNLERFEELQQIAEASKLTGNLFITLLLGCVYSWLTIATTTDVAMITNTATSNLPIIQTPIPIVGFYSAAPLLLLAMYLYYHLNWQRLWEGLANLPAIFPDGRRLDQVAYPWFLNGVVCAYFPRWWEQRPSFSGLQVILVILLAWGFVPLTLVGLWWRSLPRHDWLLTGLQLLVLALSLGFGLRSFHTARSLFTGPKASGFLMARWAWASTTIAFALVGFFSHEVISGLYSPERTFHSLQSHFGGILKKPLVYSVIQAVLFSPNANLVYAEVSFRPFPWTGKEMNQVKGASLLLRNLRKAQAKSAFLAKADLTKADLSEANLMEANLHRADFDHAKLHNTNFESANLHEAIFWWADLQGAKLVAANLSMANLVDANLRGANLRGANLQEAYLWRANFQGADLQGANLQETKGLDETQIRGAQNWVLAFYDKKGLSILKLPSDHNENLKKNDLSNYNLSMKNLRGANLQGAQLWKVDFQGADLRGANLLDSKNLTEDQVKSAFIDEETKLPEPLKHLIPKQ